jgi:hypothetical protein
MLEYEGSLFVSMALVTDCIATRECPDLAERARAMCVVAIATLNQSLIDPVTIRPRKISFGGSVAAITQIGLSPHQQMLWFLGMMRRVAIQAAHVIAGVRRTRKVPLFIIFTVTGQASRARLLPRQSLKTDDLADVTSARYVFGSRAVAGFTTMSTLQRGLEVRGALEIVLVKVLMTSFAGVAASIPSTGLIGGGYTFLLFAKYKNRQHWEQQKSRQLNPP